MGYLGYVGWIALGLAASFAAAYAACRWLSPDWQPVSRLVWASLLLSGIPQALLLVLLMIAGLVLGGGGEASGMLAFGILIFGGRVLAAATVLAGVPLAYNLATQHWGKALVVALAALLGHLLIGWPVPLLRSAAADIKEQNAFAGAVTDAAQRAAPVLQEYGLSLPPGYVVVQTDSLDYETRIYVCAQQQHAHGFHYVISAEQKDMLLSAIEGSGYVLDRHWRYGQSYIKEPYVVQIGISEQIWLRGEGVPSVELLLYKTDRSF